MQTYTELNEIPILVNSAAIIPDKTCPIGGLKPQYPTLTGL